MAARVSILIRQLRSIGAAVALTLGLLIISAFTEAAFGDASAWWQWLIGLAVAGGLSALGAMMIYAVASKVLEPIAAGWMAWISGAAPPVESGSRAAALADFALFGATTFVGWQLYKIGREAGQGNWATGGVLLIAYGVLFGLGAAVPQVALAGRASTKGQRRVTTGEHGVAVLFTVGVIGIALAMATVNLIFTARVHDGVAPVPEADWVRGCVSSELTGCSPRAELTITPRRAARLRLEYLSQCSVRLTDATDGAVEVLPAAELRRLGVASGDGRNDRARVIFDAPRGARYVVHVEPTSNVCTFAVRYLEEPQARSNQ